MKLNIIAAFLALVLISVSCTNLDETLYSQVESKDYGQTSSEISTLVGGAYATLRGTNDDISISYPTCEYVFFLNECSSDEACIPARGTNWRDGGRYIQAQQHAWESDNVMLLSAWRYCYLGINKINEKIFTIESAEMGEEAKNSVLAELRSLRAYYYYQLLDMFGNVPLSIEFGADANLPNSTRKEVYEFVEKEFKESLPYLSEEVIYGRMTQNVVNAMLARLYINSEVYIGEARWQDCIEACEKVTGYIIEPDYFTNFLTENQVSQENIFVIPYDHKEGTVGNYLHSMTFHYEHKYTVSSTGDYPWCGNGICAQPGVYSMFEDIDRRKESMLAGDQIHKGTGSVIIMDNGEPLIYTEEIGDFENAKDNEGVRLHKYEVKAGEQWERDHDWVLIRYAEILMMQAECYVRLGSADLARPFIEQICTRAGIETPSTIDMDFLDDEWLREFVFEGTRRTVNIRFGTYFEPWWSKEANEAYTAIYPIPQTELDKNPSLQQNPGY
ncbi:RagB/SusD family nutrient uptake outer membrane protein [Carboxylicivirga sp. A043]|uniref:RagB/SusD family nutrient uptake outer membrane protein n=1 Tax=Carboxylicivirga litoralis TaxID=2816963 RepID=UPI0021CB955D|nr:RagB/SusD family nutrient uptake outer membrane protein [Carboxylicivirga sp. A043]MCU4156535.1 RagB/SusD family nutrient uptake outer membrane protein [Carboxylicivirga sp. A043]